MPTFTVGGAPLAPVTLTPKYEVNAPRWVAVIDGSNYVPCAIPRLEWGAHGITDTASVEMPISNNPDFTVLLARDTTNDEPVLIEIYGGFPENPTVSSNTSIDSLNLLFTGEVDVYSARFYEDRVTFTCRSAASPLATNKVTQYTPNQTSVQFIEQVCGLYDLSYETNVANAPATLQEVLGYDQIGGASLAAALYGMNIADLILKCAQFDNADCWFDPNGIFHYVTPSLIQRNTIALVSGTDLALDDGAEGTHSPQFSNNVQVEVHTHQPTTRVSTSTRVTTGADGSVVTQQSSKVVSTTAIGGTNQTVSTSVALDGTVTVSSSAVTGGKFAAKTSAGTLSDAGKEKYVFFVQNISPERANVLANTYWRQISQHEYTIVIRVPVTVAILSNLQITSILKISGFPYAAFNGAYYPRRITHSWSVEEAWMLTIEATNHVPSLNGV